MSERPSTEEERPVIYSYHAQPGQYGSYDSSPTTMTAPHVPLSAVPPLQSPLAGSAVASSENRPDSPMVQRRTSGYPGFGVSAAVSTSGSVPFGGSPLDASSDTPLMALAAAQSDDHSTYYGGYPVGIAGPLPVALAGKASSGKARFMQRSSSKERMPRTGRAAARRRVLMFGVVAVAALALYVLVPWLFWGRQPSRSAVSEEQAQASVAAVNADAISERKLADLEHRVEHQASMIKVSREALAEKELEIAELRRQLEARTAVTTNAAVAANTDSATAETSTSAVYQPGVYRSTFHTLPASSAWCYGEALKNRTCKFKNLYFDNKKRSYFVVITADSVMRNFLEHGDEALVDMSSIEEHNSFFFKAEHIAAEHFKDVEVESVDKLTFLFSRFHVGNIMHSLHDDAIGLYHNIRQFGRYNDSATLPDYAAMSMDHYVQLDEGHYEYEYGKIFRLFSDHPLRLRIDAEKPDRPITRFVDAVVGQNKIGTWYQYGFGGPQGPIANKTVNGYHVRQTSNFIVYRLGLDPHFSRTPDTIVIFSRKSNRLLVNEEEIAKRLTATFDMETVFVRMEDHTFKEQIAILRRTKVAIVGMFLPPGSVLLELYPFAVPSENYTPYRTMSQLPGMNLVYRAWENTHEKNNIMHPDNDQLHGGLAHLPEDERKKIMETHTVPSHICCTDPYWLFRIYQDTIADPDEVIAMVKDGLAESKRFNLVANHFHAPIAPGTIDFRTVRCKPEYASDGSITGVRVRWDPPANGFNYDKYSLWEHISYLEYKSDTTSILLKSPRFTPGVTLQVWVRTVVGDQVGPYSEKVLCDIPEKQY